MSVFDDAKELIEAWPEEWGYIVAFDSRHPDMPVSPEAKFRVSFLTLHSNPKIPRELTGTNRVEEALIYPCYAQAAAAAQSWMHSNKRTTQVIEIKRHRPVEIINWYPANILDALAEV